jgi:hypothetical protein
MSLDMKEQKPIEDKNKDKGKYMNNNPLIHKYQYYLNESYKLTEQLSEEKGYTKLLEALILEFVDADQLMEYVMRGTVTHDEHGNPLSKEKSERRAHRIKQIIDMGKKLNDEIRLKGTPATQEGGDRAEKRDRIQAALRAKGIETSTKQFTPGEESEVYSDDKASQDPYRRVITNKEGDPIDRKGGSVQVNTDSPNSSYDIEKFRRAEADDAQKSASKMRRTMIRFDKKSAQAKREDAQRAKAAAKEKDKEKKIKQQNTFGGD